MRATVAFPVTTKDIGQLGSRFSCRPLMSERRHRRLSVRESQKVQRIRRCRELGLADLQVALRTL